MRVAKWASALSVLMLSAALAAPAWAAPPTPREVLGFDVGEDYKLATYEDSVAYFHKLAASTDRMKMFKGGKTTQGRTFEYAVISTPANLAKWDHYKEVSKRLAEIDGLDDASAKALAKDAKIIIHIDGGMHSSEVAAHQSMIDLAYKLVATEGDAQIDAIRENVLTVVWPTVNPDGMTMVAEWYRKNLKTPWESRMPYLYQEYVGHDNNRDGYMLNMIESQSVYKETQDYSPVVLYSHHQTAPNPARIWVPPFSDPMSSNISPYVRTWTTSIGINMMTEFESRQMPGAIAQASFDNWYPGFLDYTHVFRNTIAYFTESAHASATPRFYDPKAFPRDFRDQKALVMYPSPWKGGQWHLADTIRYDTVASLSTLDTAVRYREVLLYNRYQAGRDMAKRYVDEGLFAYVIPGGQPDAPQAALLTQKLLDQGMRISVANAPLTIGGQTYPAGSWVIPMDQPYAGLAKELFELQKYPDAVLSGGAGGKPATLPYDVTGWTLPLQMGVKTVEIREKLSPQVLASLQRVTKAEVQGGIIGDGNVFALSRKVNASFRVINDAVAKGAKLQIASETVKTVNGDEPSAVILTGISRAALQDIAARHGVTATAMAKAPAGQTIKKGRVGLYRPWGSNMDEGWTRWLLEQYAFAPVSLYNADIRKGGLRAKFDTIILPDLRDRDGLLNGMSELDIPAQYAGGISDEGTIALKKFVSEGGTLVALNSASNAIIDLFALPVTDVVRNADDDTFFCSGALLQVSLGQSSRATVGMAAEPAVMFSRGPVFQPRRGFKGNVLASYAPEGNPLRSGVLLHPEAIRGRAAALEVEYGTGRVFLYGFRPQFRGQSHGTYKLLFNLLYAYEGQEPSATDLTAAPGGRGGD
ncbi:MAG: M14 metallopeptidase family protein [Steroidobacteraceae bacterium]